MKYSMGIYCSYGFRKGIFFLLVSAIILSTTACDSDTQPAFQYDESTIASLHDAMTHQSLTCREVIEHYIDKIKRVNLALNRGAPLNAIVSVNPSALDQAHQLDKHYAKTHQFIGPLHCVPVIIKDNINTIDTPSSSGSLALLGSQPAQNAFLVTQLRKAGAIIIAKGAMDEFASGISGISSRSGRVGNAYNPTQNPGGSSSGPAVAVSANLAMIAIGTDNSGSIRIPAAFNGLYGLRPGRGVVSLRGIFPRGNLDGVAGPMARNLKDLHTVMAVIAKSDKHDRKTLTYHRPTFNNTLSADSLQRKRIGLVRLVGTYKPFDNIATDDAKRVFASTLTQLQKKGVALVDIELPDFDMDRTNNMAGEIGEINAYLRAFVSTRRNFDDICQSKRSVIFTEITCRQHKKLTTDKGNVLYQQILRTFAKNMLYVQTIMDKHHVDVLLMPISKTGSPTYDNFAINTWQAPVSSNSGLPAINFVVGYTRNKPKLPIAMELIGRNNSEEQLINMAYAYSTIVPRIPPDLQQPATSPLAHLTIPEFNTLLTEIGAKAYQTILIKQPKKPISPMAFSKIIKQVLIENGIAPPE